MALFFYKEKNKDIRAAAYLRLSIEDGDKAESNSIGNQRELIRDFAAERPGLHLVEEYADDGYTGTNFERPGFKRMMEDIKSGKINCIIVKDLSRLGRNYIEMGKYLEQIFPMMGIRFIAINDNYDNANTESSDSDSIVVPFKNLLNDSYCRDISIKVRSQLDMKRRKGEFIGGYAIYGYCKDKRNKNRLVVDEYAADIVRSIYRRKLEGMSAQAIAEQLNSENVLAPSEYKRLCGLNYHSGFKAGTHAKWQAIQVLRILKNEVYTGTMVQGRRQKINYKIKKIRDVEESGWIRVPNMHEAIIPQKLFDTVQEVLKLDTCASKGQQTVNLFSGIVRCGSCGQNMVRRTVSKNGKKYIYLHCVTNHNGLGCSSHLISESKLAEVVLAALQGKVQQISGLEHRLDEINEIPKNERRLKSVEEHLKMLEQEEQKYQTLRRQLYEDMSSGIVSKEEYKEFSHFSRYASGQKMRDIAKWLNEQGVEPPMRHKKRILGKSYDAESDQWTTDMLRCLFRNPTYTGAAANGSRQIIAENCHEPYITKEQFYAFPCNMREGENKISIRKSYKKPNPLAKHIVCTCGYALCWHKDKKTEEELFYCRHCRAHKENGKNLKVPAATIYKKVMDALELEHLEEEKLAAAIQQGAGRKVIEAVRAEKSVQMKSVLAELNMEQFRRVPLYESYMADEITKEQYCAELLDYEEAHRKLNEQLTAIMEDTLVWERALSLRNPWIQQMAQYKTPEELDRNFVKKYIEQVTVTLLDDGQVEISLTMKTDEWKQMLSRIEVEGTDSGTKE